MESFGRQAAIATSVKIITASAGDKSSLPQDY